VADAFTHITVLRDASVEHLLAHSSRGGHRFLDGTLGGGGHSEALLRAAPDGATVLGIDRDPHALAAARARLTPFGERFRAIRGTFGQMVELVEGPFDGIVLDVGVSSPQLDHAARGFSLREDGPVDMRMDPDQALDAAGLLADLDEAGLMDILRRYGEEPRARRIARAILAGRPWAGTLALADAVARASGYRNSRVHPATRTFQALRIAVNDELGQLERGLDAGLALLAPGGRFAVISFHSLEDRMVKRRFRKAAGVGTPRDAFGHPAITPLGQLVTRKPISGADADADNPRARSAQLRVFERAHG
jgi:16S rRNA (cytosine1402-N4)-methyltransferase